MEGLETSRVEEWAESQQGRSAFVGDGSRRGGSLMPSASNGYLPDSDSSGGFIAAFRWLICLRAHEQGLHMALLMVRQLH
ncbi:hypothetical protein EYF80_039338 [Liparis tanakae]|uniref:Uncharacterized protein n=1 Tax=Liparis tanakae TaxID=230148 RepID=A0A4Z2GAQ8_9TELE|nr:hypothetical protein EYF80_039338 [Liparis tanakae]